MSALDSPKRENIFRDIALARTEFIQKDLLPFTLSSHIYPFIWIGDCLDYTMRQYQYEKEKEFGFYGEDVEHLARSPYEFIKQNPFIQDIMGLKQKKESISFFNDNMVMGSLSMTSILIRS